MGRRMLYALLFGLCVSSRCAAVVWSCDTAKDIVAPRGTGAVFGGGWILERAECSEAGVYYYTFTRGGVTAEVSVSLGPGGRGDKTYISSQYGGAPDAVEAALVKDVSGCVAAWESRLERDDIATWAVIVAGLLLSALWLGRISRSAQRGRAGAAVNLRIIAATLILAIFGVEFIFRCFNVSYRDTGLMAFMGEVRDQAVLHGGFRRVGGATTDAENAPLKVDAIGYRGGWAGGAKKPGTIRIACAGDSFMFGVGVGDEWTFPRQLENELRKKFRGKTVEALNFGVPGSSAEDVSSTLLAEAQSAEPDVVIYGYVLNDIALGRFLDSRAYYDGIGIKTDSLSKRETGGWRGWARRHIRVYNYFAGRYEDKLVGALVGDMYSKSYEPVNNSDGLRRLEKEFAIISGHYRARGVPVVLMIYPILVGLDGKYPYEASHKRVAEMAKKAGMRVIDLLPYFKGKKEETLWAGRTDHHPNREGHGIAASAVAEFLVRGGFVRKKPEIASAPAAGEDDILNSSEAALKNGEVDAALEILSAGLEKRMDSCKLNNAAARVFEARGAYFALGRKIERMKSISAECAAEAQRIEAAARKAHGGIVLE